MTNGVSKDFFISNLLSSLKDFSQEDLKKIQTALTENLKDYIIESEDITFNEEDNWEEFRDKTFEAFKMAKLVEGKSKGTVKLYEMTVLDFFKLCNKPLHKVTPYDIRLYLMEIQKTRGITSRTADNKRSCINSFFSWCAAEKIIDANPCSNVKPIKYERIPKKALTDEEMVLIREGCKNIRDRALIEFLYSTGARVTEVVTCKISDVDLDKNEVIVLGKGNKHRKSYLSASAHFYLQKYLESRTDKNESLFVGMREPHNGLKKVGIEKILRQLGDSLGFEVHLTPHIFRHTCATHALQCGVDVAEISQILGHENISTTMIYSKVNDEDVKNHHKKTFS